MFYWNINIKLEIILLDLMSWNVWCKKDLFVSDLKINVKQVLMPLMKVLLGIERWLLWLLLPKLLQGSYNAKASQEEQSFQHVLGLTLGFLQLAGHARNTSQERYQEGHPHQTSEPPQLAMGRSGVYHYCYSRTIWIYPCVSYWLARRLYFMGSSHSQRSWCADQWLPSLSGNMTLWTHLYILYVTGKDFSESTNENIDHFKRHNLSSF